MQIDESSNIDKPRKALKRVMGDCASGGKAEILLSKREIPIIEYGIQVKEAIENNSESVLLS